MTLEEAEKLCQIIVSAGSNWDWEHQVIMLNQAFPELTWRISGETFQDRKIIVTPTVETLSDIT